MDAEKKQKIKLAEITPDSMHCGIGACPAIYKTSHETYILIGVKLKAQHAKELLQGKIGVGEAAIEIPKRLIDDLADPNR